MAINITTTANLTDTSLGKTVTVTGLGSGNRLMADIRIGGVLLATITGAVGASSVTPTWTLTNFYNLATQYAQVGSCSVFAYEKDGSNNTISSASVLNGDVTISGRLSSPIYGNSNNYSLDLTTLVATQASWTRPHTAFRARVKLYVNNVLIYTRTGFSTSISYVPSAAEKDSMIAAMADVTPRYMHYILETGFYFNGTTWYTTAGSIRAPASNSASVNQVVKVFLVASTISIGSATLTSALTTIPYTLTVNTSGATHTVRLFVGGVQIVEHTGVTTSGNFTIGATERTAILNAIPNSTSGTSYAWVQSSKDGSTATHDSSNVATTVAIGSEYVPVLGTISWAESTATTYVATALGYGAGTKYFLTAKSKVTFTVPATMPNTATTRVSTRVVFAGTDQTTAGTGTTTTTAFLSTAGTLNYTITVTDSRGRTASSTAGAIVVRAYVYPKINSFSVYRATSTVEPNPLGTDLRVNYNVEATAVNNLSSVNINWVKFVIQTRLLPSGSFGAALAISNTTNTTVLTLSAAPAAAVISYLVANSYEVRIRAYDRFYDLDNDASALEDTDDYTQGLQTLSYGKVALMIGDEVASIGKVWAQGTLDVGGDIYSNGVRVARINEVVSPVIAGSSAVSALSYNGITHLAGTLYGGTTVPTGTTRLNYGGYFYPTFINLSGSDDTVTAATHYFVEQATDGFVRPKTIANVRTEIVTKAAVEAILTGAITTHSHVAAQLPNNVVALWTGTISTTGTTGTLSSAVTNFDFVLVFGFTDNANSENGTSMLIYSKGGLLTNVRAYNIGSNISTTANATLMFSFPTSTSIRLDLVAGASTEALRSVYGINLM